MGFNTLLHVGGRGKYQGKFSSDYSDGKMAAFVLRAHGVVWILGLVISHSYIQEEVLGFYIVKGTGYEWSD